MTGSESGPSGDQGAHDATTVTDGGGGSVTWAQGFGGTSSEHGNGLAVDPGGNLYVTGYFSGTTNLGGGDLTTTGSLDIFLASYSPTGAHLWSENYGGSSSDVGKALAVDNASNVYALGYFNGTATLGGGNLGAVGSQDMFLASYSSGGTHNWSQSHGGDSTDNPQAVAVDPSGNIFVVGYFSGTASFGGPDLSGTASTHIFLVKYDSSGGHQWSKSFGTSGSNHGMDVAVNTAGNSCITGYFVNNIDFGSGALASNGGWDLFAACFSPAGSPLWSKGFGGGDSDMGRAVALDATGNVYLGGSVAGPVDLGGGLLSGLGGTADAFVACYGPNGAHVWSKIIGGSGYDHATAMALGPAGEVYVTGSCHGSVDLGGGVLPSFGTSDIFVASYAADGAHRWSKTFGGASADLGQALAVGPGGEVYASGYFYGPADLGAGTMSSSGGSDLFVIKLAP
jgi:hypothetical protein